jgi:acylphosphatase
VVRGAVQGVGFRYFVLRRAREAGLHGWVRNRADGSVECVAEGARPALEQLLAALGSGPRMARVAGVTADWKAPRGDLPAFDVRA